MTAHVVSTAFSFLIFFAILAGPTIGIMRMMDVGDPLRVGVYIGLFVFALFLLDVFEHGMPTPNYILSYFIVAFCIFAPLCYLARFGAYALWIDWGAWFLSAAYLALSAALALNHKPWLLLAVLAAFVLIFGRALAGALHHFTTVNQSGYESAAVSEQRAEAAKAQSERVKGDTAIAQATMARERALAELRDAEREVQEAEKRSKGR